jgi:hypothetical protein
MRETQKKSPPLDWPSHTVHLPCVAGVGFLALRQADQHPADHSF